jgi:hypothetical protein
MNRKMKKMREAIFKMNIGNKISKIRERPPLTNLSRDSRGSKSQLYLSLLAIQAMTG